MRKTLIIIGTLLVAMLLILGACAPTPEYTETQFTVSGGTIYRLNIFANEGDTIEGYWKADGAVYRWWTSPGGCAYPLEKYSEEVTGVFQPTPLDPEPGFWIEGKEVRHSMGGMFGGDINIECKVPYGQSGYYTVCFMPWPYDTNQSVNVTVRYGVD
jgi:hypothetical protein